jgi:hypothetical protein
VGILSSDTSPQIPILIKGENMYGKKPMKKNKKSKKRKVKKIKKIKY